MERASGARSSWAGVMGMMLPGSITAIANGWRADRRIPSGLPGPWLAGVAAALSGALLMGPAVAQATVVALPAETSSVYINTGYSSTTQSTYAQLGGGTGSISLQPYVSLQARINNQYTQDVFSTLDYDFQVEGGSPGDSVPLLIATNLLASGTYPQYGAASIGVFTGGGVGLAGEMVCTYPSDCPATQFSGTLSLTASAGDVYRIHLRAIAEGSNVSASADPYIYVDPHFAGAGNYSIAVSSGVANAPVPEPATWAMMLVGFGLLGLSLSRRGADLHA